MRHVVVSLVCSHYWVCTLCDRRLEDDGSSERRLYEAGCASCFEATTGSELKESRGPMVVDEEEVDEIGSSARERSSRSKEEEDEWIVGRGTTVWSRKLW